MIAMPAGTRKRVGILLANQTAEMVLDTYVSRNIPSLISVPFGDQKLRRKVRPFEGEEMQLLADEPPPAFAQYVVDNEDEGFEAAAAWLGAEEARSSGGPPEPAAATTARRNE